MQSRGLDNRKTYIDFNVRVGKMQRFGMRKAEWGRHLQGWQRRYSRLARTQTTEASCLPEQDVVSVPKMPPFDYSPPPYTGPTLDEIFNKRKEFLSPSMFYFYNKPVSCGTPLIPSLPSRNTLFERFDPSVH